MTLAKKPFKNIVGKRENTNNQYFLLYPERFLPFALQISNFQSHLFCRLQALLVWTSLEILSFGKGLNELSSLAFFFRVFGEEQRHFLPRSPVSYSVLRQSVPDWPF